MTLRDHRIYGALAIVFILAWPGQLPGQAGSYPGLPALSFSAAVPAGDPDRQRLLAAADWVANNHAWPRHYTELTSLLERLALNGSKLQWQANLEKILVVPNLVLALEQATFIRAVGAQKLNVFSADGTNREFLKWLLARPRALALLRTTLVPDDDVSNVLAQWRAIWSDDPESRETFISLAIACAVVFDEPVPINRDIYGSNQQSTSYQSDANTGSVIASKVSSLERFRFFRDRAKQGALRTALPEMMPWELVWVVDAPVPESELLWAQKHVNYSQRDWGKAYGHIRYRMDRAAEGKNPYTAYTLEQIEKEGGICGDQAYFAAISAKANGIPAMVIGGVGDRGGHAWLGYLQSRANWNLTTGRYNDSYASGSTQDPQSRKEIKEHQLHERTDPARRTPEFQRSQLMLALARILAEQGQPLLALSGCDSALRLAPKNFEAWNLNLDLLEAAGVDSKEWMRQSARMRSLFSDFSDLLQLVADRELAYATAHPDGTDVQKLQHRQTQRLLSKDSERTDLYLQNVIKSAELAAKSGPEAVARVYRDAFKNKGGEMVAFRQLAESYYQWAAGASQGPKVVRDLISLFDRTFQEPGADIFALGAYRETLRLLSNFCKQQGLDSQQRSLERRETKLAKLEEKIGKTESRNSR